jgi:hypothetical protein
MKALRLVNVLLVCLAVCACPKGEPRFDLTDATTYKSSLTQIVAGLSSAEKDELEGAMRTLLLGSLDDEPSENPFMSMMKLASMATPDGMMARLKPMIHGKTAREVIVLASTEQAKAQERQIARIDEQIGSLKDEVGKDEAALAKAQSVLGKVILDRAKFYFSDSGFMTQPVIDFEIRNQSDLPLKRIYVHGILETPGRTIPWVDDTFNYEFQGGLEKGEEKHLRLSPNMFSNWGDADLKGQKTLLLTLELLDVAGPSGERVAGISADEIEAKREKIKSLIEKRAEVAGKVSQ